MNGNERQQQLQRIMMQAENFKRQAEEIGQQIEMVRNTRDELSLAKEAVNSLKDNESGAKMLVPAGPAVHLKVTLEDADNVIVGIGADVSAEKSVDEAVKFIEKKDKELEGAVSRFQEVSKEINNKLRELDSEYQRLVGEIQSERQQQAQPAQPGKQKSEEDEEEDEDEE